MKLVILDRDGVINHDSEDYIKSPDEWHPIEGSLKAIALLHQAGFKVAVATNQSGIGRQFYDENTLEQIHHKLQKLVKEAGGAIEKIVFCPHHPDDNCACRKPEIGMLQSLSTYFDDPLHKAFFVGDSLRDLQAAQSFGCIPVLVRTGNGFNTEKNLPQAFNNIAIFDDLLAFAKSILNLGFRKK